MSDNEDLLGDYLGDQSLADYNLGNEEEEQLLADDYEHTGPQNVPSSLGTAYREPVDNIVPQPQQSSVDDYGTQTLSYQHPPTLDTECVVPNITVEVPNPVVQCATYAPYEPPAYDEHAVPPAIPAAPVESPQIVPSDVVGPVSNGAVSEMDLGPRERFVSERPPGAQRMPQVRDIPDSLDKVVIPRGGGMSWPRGAGRTWRSVNYVARHPTHAPHANYSHPYRRNNMHRGNFNQRAPFPPPQIRPNPTQMRPDIRPDIRMAVRPDLRPEFRPEMHPDLRPEPRPDFQPRPEIRPEPRLDVRPDLLPELRPDLLPELRSERRHEMRPDLHPDMAERRRPPQMGPEISPERPILPQEMPMFRPPIERPQFFPRFQFRPNIEERPQFGPRPNYDQRFFRPNFPPRHFPPPIREMPPNPCQMQVTIRQPLPVVPGPSLDKMGPKGDIPQEPEVRMLPVALPTNLPPSGLAGKKVLINPHFKGTFQPPVEGLPAYIPTRIQKSPPRPTNIENKFGPVKNIDDAAERFIAEQRNALARAAVRKQARRSPQRYIENTTIEIQNDLAHNKPYIRNDDDDLLRRQEEFINANRAGLRRRMRTPSPPPRRSLSPRRSPERRPRQDDERHDEDSEYKRRLREQESLRERVLRAKEVRRRKNAVALHKQLQEKEREVQEKPAPQALTPPETIDKPTSTDQENKPDTTRKSPEKEKLKEVAPPIVRDRSPVKEAPQVNSTVENLTPPHRLPVKQESPERALTPPLPEKKEDKKLDSDDDLDLILGDIDGILSDEDDSGRFKDKAKKTEQQPPKPKGQVDLRSRLPPKANSTTDKKPQRQKIIFQEETETKKKRDKSPPRRAIVSSSTKLEDTDVANENKKSKTKPKVDNISIKSRQRIIYNNKEDEKEIDDKKSSFSNRRVILQRQATKEKSALNRVDVKTDPTKPNPGIFSRAVRTAIGGDSSRIVIKKDEPQIQYESDSDMDEDHLLQDTGSVATVQNLPHGMTDTRLKTLAGNDVQSLILDKEDRTAKITFKTTVAAETFKKKFNNKMVAASRLTVVLR